MVQGIHSKHTFVSLDGTDISTYVDDISIDDAADEVETTGFGDETKMYASGFRDVSASMGGSWGDTIATQMAALRDSGAVVPLIDAPEGNGAGDFKYLYDAIVLSFNHTGGIGAARRWSANLRLSNPSVGTFS